MMKQPWTIITCHLLLNNHPADCKELSEVQILLLVQAWKHPHRAPDTSQRSLPCRLQQALQHTPLHGLKVVKPEGQVLMLVRLGALPDKDQRLEDNALTTQLYQPVGLHREVEREVEALRQTLRQTEEGAGQL